MQENNRALTDLVKEVWESRFSLSDPIEEDIANFKIFVEDEVYDVGSQGCIGLWTGRQKSRKTFALNCAIGSGIIGEPIGPFQYIPNGGAIVHFDTEQPKNRWKITQKRLYNVAGIDVGHDNDRYFSLNLRKYGWRDRVGIINQICKKILADVGKIDLLCIDGIVDICENFNENVAASATTQQIMTWGEELDCTLYTVLHTTKTSGEARGHLGTELTNKVDFNVEVKKKEVDSIYSTVLSRDSRYFPFKSFDLYQTREGLIDMDRGSWMADKIIEQHEQLPF